MSSIIYNLGLQVGSLIKGTKRLGRKGVDATKKAIHDKQRNIALDVIDDTKDKVVDSKSKMILKGAEEIVSYKYKGGGMIGTNVHILDKNSLMYKKSGVIVGEVGTSWLVETTERKGLVNKKKVEVIKSDKMKTGGGVNDFDSNYWLQYNKKGATNQTPDYFYKESKNLEDTFEEAIDEWNSEADNEDNKIKGKEVQYIKNTAKKFFEKEKWISINIIQAMIMQEAGSKMKTGGSIGDKLPPAKIYGENLGKAIEKFNITESEARKKYGNFTINQWKELLGDKMKTGGEVEGMELMGGQPNSSKPSGYFLLEVKNKGKEIIVSDDGGKTKERYVKNNGYSGYTIHYKGNQYEFVDSYAQGGATKGFNYSIGGL